MARDAAIRFNHEDAFGGDTFPLGDRAAGDAERGREVAGEAGDRPQEVHAVENSGHAESLPWVGNRAQAVTVIACR